ncbi:tol-pal system protein YbgF [Petrachloros mirabilis]
MRISNPRAVVILMLMVCLGMAPAMVNAAPIQAQDAARHMYDRVMEEFKRHDYEAALAGFRFFLDLHGQTSLAANAQYWMGECQFRMGRYKDALQSFYQVVSYYPLSHKLPASTLKIGQTYEKLRDREKARMMFEKVIEQYPDSPEADIARKFIEPEMATAESVVMGNN